MPTTPLEILYIALAASTIVLTVFLCSTLYYIIYSLRDVQNVTHGIKNRVEKIFDFIDKMKDKTQATATTATVLSKAAIEVVDYVKEKRDKKKKKKEK